VAVERYGARQRAITSAELVRENGETRLYNSLQVRTYTQPAEIGELIDAIARERVQVEVWLPKARLDGQYFDLRVVVIGGRPEHFVVRQSRSPMTNLHLGNRRGNREAFLARIEAADWFAVQQTCLRVMECFPCTLYAGIDVALLPNFRDHAVLEVNAFGDLLPGIEVDGRDTYTAEVEALQRCLSPFAAARAAANGMSQGAGHGD
jgi:hypothetical protein